MKDLSTKVTRLQGDLTEYQQLLDKIVRGELVIRQPEKSAEPREPKLS